MGLTSEVQSLIQRPRIIPGVTTANWNTGIATSGLAGANLVTVGGPNQWYRLNQFALVLNGFNAAAIITMRAYMDIAGVNRLILTDDWTIATSEDVAYLSWFFDAEFFGPFRVEVFSNNIADNGFTATYEYRIKDW
jgi:hypothetical protein